MLRSIFAPRHRNKALRAFRDAGDRVISINPHHAVIEGETAYPSDVDYADEIHLATLYVPPRIGEQVVESLAQKGIGEVWFDPGADAPQVVARARALGLRPIVACSIIGIGMSPSRF